MKHTTKFSKGQPVSIDCPGYEGEIWEFVRYYPHYGDVVELRRADYAPDGSHTMFMTILTEDWNVVPINNNSIPLLD